MTLDSGMRCAYTLVCFLSVWGWWCGCMPSLLCPLLLSSSLYIDYLLLLYVAAKGVRLLSSCACAVCDWGCTAAHSSTGMDSDEVRVYPCLFFVCLRLMMWMHAFSLVSLAALIFIIYWLSALALCGCYRCASSFFVRVCCRWIRLHSSTEMDLGMRCAYTLFCLSAVFFNV